MPKNTVTDYLDHHDQLSNSSKEYIRTVLKLHKLIMKQKNDELMLSLSAPITKGGRFPLVRYELDKAHIEHSIMEISEDIKHTDKKSLSTWDKNSIPPYKRVEIIYLMQVHGMKIA